ncbi:MAG: 3-methyl-2-oxobutanoate hydroxymethyltransferase [Chloroflexi bacterium]|nr:3-methyl-2-oxobutanoate hydroxymethyltransferase [Chloroflexota bacterium]
MRVTIHDLQQMKARGERIPMLTAYDYSTARILDEAGVPLILVGDSLGMVMLGYDTTLPVTLEVMLHHIKAVVRGTKRAFVVGDMPFMSYQTSVADALRNAGRLLQEAGSQAVKLEGGEPMADTVRRLVEVGIPVQGHLGFTPQSVNQLGVRVQGRSKDLARRLVNDAVCLEQAGAFSIVLEMVPAPLARLITARVKVPTIGIGAGPYCDGQVQVIHDMLGLYPDFVPKHAKQYAQMGRVMQDAVTCYLNEVTAGAFPTSKESFGMDQQVLEAVIAELGPE